MRPLCGLWSGRRDCREETVRTHHYNGKVGEAPTCARVPASVASKTTDWSEVTCRWCQRIGESSGAWFQRIGESCRSDCREEAVSRSDGERVRAEQVIRRLRACIAGIELALSDHDTPIGNEGGQAITSTAIELAVLLAKLDAYQRSEADARRKESM